MVISTLGFLLTRRPWSNVSKDFTIYNAKIKKRLGLNISNGLVLIERKLS